MSDARKRAEEALATVAERYPNGWGGYDTLSICTEALRALLAEGHEAPVLPLEAPECNDGDDCCRYCGRGLQPCGACKPEPVSDPYTLPPEVQEAAEMLNLTLRMRKTKATCNDRACSNVALGALNLLSALAARRGDV